MPGVLSKYAEGGRTMTPFTGDYYTYGTRPEHQFFTGRNPAPAVAPGSGMTGLPATPTAPQRQGGGSSGMNILTGVLGAAGAANTIGKAFGKENVVGDALGALGRFLGINKPKLEEVIPSVRKLPTGIGDEVGSGWDGTVEDVTGVRTGLLDRVLGGVGGAGSIYSGIEQGGVKGAGQIASGASSVADALGKKVPGLGTIGAIGDLIQGDVSTPSSAFNTAGAAAKLGSKALASSGALGGTTGTVGSALGAIGSVAPIAAIGFAATDLLNKQLNAHGDEKRNVAAFEQAFPGIQRLRAPGRAGAGLTFVALPDGRVISAKNFEKLAGTWYGAAYAPDGNQEQWKSDLESLNASLVGNDPMYEKLKDILKPVKAAEGGGILGQSLGYTPSQESKLIEGPGTGRSDDIPARLSAGEYVMDAETVALLGDGSTDAGAAKLDELRERLRKHKGRKLVKGKFSDNAKDAAAYLGDR
jgi:hypothetical protein